MASPPGASPPGAELDGLIALLNAGRLDDMVVRGEQLLGRFPRSFVICDLLGMANGGLGRFEQAVRCFRQALTIEPGYAPGHRNLGIMFQKLGRIDEAIACYRQVVAIAADDAAAHYNMGVALQGLGRIDEAIACYRQVVGIAPDFADAHYNMGVALEGLGRIDEAVACYEQAVRIAPDHADAHNNLGVLLQALGRMDEAAASHQHALRIRPDHADAHNNLGTALQGLGRIDEAIACYEKALRIRPDHAEAHYSLGTALQGLGRMDEAIACYVRALRIRPENAEAHYNLGVLLQGLHRMEEAIACYDRALRIRPEHAEAHYNRGVALQGLLRMDEAIACYEKDLGIRPEHAEARAQKLHLQANICDWDGLQSEADAISALGVAGDAVSPLSMLSFDDNPERNRIRSERYAAGEYRPSSLPALIRPTAKPDRLRIGYFSADFHNHATMHLMVRLFELHDRSRFALHLFSYGFDPDDAMRQRLKHAVDMFHDVRDLKDSEVAELARHEQIDIAVDLKGYTQGYRLGFFALRAAPVQISYLGYPGTLGTPFIDYIIADKVVVPETQRQHYTEKLIYLPHSYQVNDDSRVISDRMITRAAMGLPEDGFIFCCFNASYKVTAAEFDIWMRLLDQVEGSVLWLFKTTRGAAANLREQAKRRGIDPDRLIFADRIASPEHLARHRLADLFLDTFNVNAHTTASDALWAGLPLVTRAGQGFAARVAASLLAAVGLPELITTGSADYERVALELARDSARLADIRQRLGANRLTEPLFNSALSAGHIETAYQLVYDRYFEGGDPTDISIPDAGPDRRGRRNG